MSAVNIDEGTILEALNDKLDRDANNLDTSTTNFDVVVDYQVPTAENNYTWYRKYASGWVEQGGEVTTSTPATVSLIVQMANDYYSVTANFANGTDGAVWFKTRTTVSFQIQGHEANGLATWQVKGMAAA